MSVAGYIQDPTGIGQFGITTVLSPAPGVPDTFVTVPAGEIWVPLTVSGGLSTAGVAHQTRAMCRATDDLGNEYIRTVADYIQLVDEIFIYDFMRGVENKVSLLNPQVPHCETPLPHLQMPAGHSLHFSFLGGANDALGDTIFTYLIYRHSGL